MAAEDSIDNDCAAEVVSSGADEEESTTRQEEDAPTTMMVEEINEWEIAAAEAQGEAEAEEVCPEEAEALAAEEVEVEAPPMTTTVASGAAEEQAEQGEAGALCAVTAAATIPQGQDPAAMNVFEEWGAEDEVFAPVAVATGGVWQAQPLEPQPVPLAWVTVMDESSGRPYYWNRDTNEVAWEHPAAYRSY